MLAQLAGLERDELLDRARRGDGRRASSPTCPAPGRLRFAHVLIRDTLYDDSTPPRRPRMHRARREALEALLRRRPRAPPGRARPSLAHRRRRLRRTAVDYARRAGDRALALARLRGGRAPLRDGARALDRRRRDGRAASCCSRSARRGRGPATRPARRRRSSRPPSWPSASDCRAAGPRRGSATAGRHHLGSRGDDARLVPLLEEGPGRARRRGRQLRGPGCSPVSPGRCATSRRAIVVTAEQGGGRARPRARETPPRSRTRSTAGSRHHGPGHGRRVPRPRHRAPRGGRADRRHTAGRARVPASNAPRVMIGDAGELDTSVHAMSRSRTSSGSPLTSGRRAPRGCAGPRDGQVHRGRGAHRTGASARERVTRDGDPRVPAPAIHALRLPRRRREARAGDPRARRGLPNRPAFALRARSCPRTAEDGGPKPSERSMT